ncbi:hypothetical protein FRC17_003461 [Serendipita sp. 399]|nr:hypothetical protein FRC17_003461 [Serendipita sp. 399]
MGQTSSKRSGTPKKQKQKRAPKNSGVASRLNETNFSPNKKKINRIAAQIDVPSGHWTSIPAPFATQPQLGVASQNARLSSESIQYHNMTELTAQPHKGQSQPRSSSETESSSRDKKAVSKAMKISIASKLPPELLAIVFAHLPRSYYHCRGFKRGAVDFKSWGVARVCRSWYSPAMSALYECIDLSRLSKVVPLSRTLEEHVQLRPLIRSIAFPSIWSCYPSHSPLFLQIISKLERLDEVRVPIMPTPEEFRRYEGHCEIPEELQKQTNLTALCLSLFQSGGSSFPDALTRTFIQLRYLDLDQVDLKYKPTSLLPLPYLYSITCTSWNTMESLDEWLFACPRLKELSLYGTCVTFGRKDLLIFSKRKITRLVLKASMERGTTPPNTHGLLAGIRDLEIPAYIFAKLYLHFPSKLDTLNLNFGSLDDIRSIVRYLRDAELGKLLMVTYSRKFDRAVSADTHDDWSWFSQDQDRAELLRVCRERDIPLELDVRN